MIYLEKWRTQLNISLNEFAHFAATAPEADLQHNLLGAAILWPIRRDIQNFDGEALDAVRDLCGPEAKHIFKAVQNWNDDPLAATHDLAAQTKANQALAEVLNKLIQHFQAIGPFAEALAQTRVEKQGRGDVYSIAGQIKAALVNIGGVTNIQTLMFNLEGPLAEARRAPFTVPPLPSHFVERPAEYEQLRHLLLADGPSRTVGLTTAFQGGGGFGKTTLALALGRDEEVRAAFPDGILFITLGEKPTNLLGLLLDQLRLFQPTTPDYTNLDTAAARLREELANRRVLLILDDVWSEADARPFIQPSPGCAHLLTTRRQDVAARLEARTINVNEMTPIEATHLLTGWLHHRTLSETEQAALTSLAHDLGEWPLLLELVAAQIWDGVEQEQQSLLAAVAEVRQRLARRGLTAFDRTDEGQRNQAISLSLGLSMERLGRWRDRYLELAVFPEDTNIPEAVLARLWQHTADLDDLDAADALRAMRRLSLFSHYDSTDHTIRLHDVVHRYLVEQQGNHLPVLHQQLLTAYRSTQTGDGWDTAPDDGYLYDHLAYHLDQSVPIDEPAPELEGHFSNHNWMQARVAQTDYTYDGYIDDVMTAWQRAQTQVQKQLAVGQPPIALADCTRYALIRTSLNSLSGNYVPALVARAVETGLWTAHRALSMASKIPESQFRYNLALALLPLETLTPVEQKACRRLVLGAALMIQNEEDRANALTELIPHSSGEVRERIQAQALDATLKIENEWSRADTLTKLVPHLNEPLLTQALDAVLKIENEQSRADTLTKLVPHLSGETRERILTQALDAVMKIEGAAWSYADTLTRLVPHLSGETRERILTLSLDVALKIEFEGFRARALTGLVPFLYGEARERTLTQALKVALKIEFEDSRARALTELAPHLTGEVRECTLSQALDTALKIENELSRAEALTRLLPYLAGELRDRILAQALDATLKIGIEKYCAAALTELAPHLNEPLLIRAMDAVLKQWDKGEYARALANLATYLIGEVREHILTRSLEAALKIGDIELKSWDEMPRAMALTELAPHLSEPLLVLALEAALKMGGEWSRAHALTGLVPYLSGETRERTLAQAFDAVMKSRDEDNRADALTELAPHLTGEVREHILAQALEAALKIEDEWSRAPKLIILAPHLSGETRERTLAQALDAALKIENVGVCAFMLTHLAPHLSEPLQAQALEAALKIEDEEARAYILFHLAPHLSDPLQAQALKSALKIRDEGSRACALTGLAPHLSESLLTQVLNMTLEIRNERLRVLTLTHLAPHLSRQARKHLLIEALDTMLKIEDELYRANALTKLAPNLSWSLLVQGVIAELWALQGAKREAVLRLLANETLFNPTRLSLPPESVAEISKYIIEICTEWQWT